MKHERNERDTGKKKRLRDSDIDKEARQNEIETEWHRKIDSPSHYYLFILFYLKVQCKIFNLKWMKDRKRKK